MADISVYKQNDVYMQVCCDRGIAAELYDFFTFKVPGYQFMPKYKAKIWDGNIRLYNTSTGLLYLGLFKYLEVFAQERNYSIDFVDKINLPAPITQEDIADIIRKKLPLQVLDKENDTWHDIFPYDYQLEAVTEAIKNKRALFLSATSSGKSLILYLTARILHMSGQAKRTLIMVPRTSLVEQLTADFCEYGNTDSTFDPNSVAKLYSGKDKNTKAQIVISTWQSLQHMSPEWLSQFDSFFIDEAHEAKSKELSAINMKMVNCPYKLGFTGTIDDAEAHKLMLEGLIGPVIKIISARELIEQGFGADMSINVFLLNYKPEDRKTIKEMNYHDEFQYIIDHPSRNKFIKNLALKLKGNTLILYERVEGHGIPLFEAIKAEARKGRKIYIVHKDIKPEDREYIRREVEKDSDAIIVASFGTFSTGINIKNLHNIIFASPSKSMIRICQSLGRGLRKSGSKSSVTVWDIIDDLSSGKYQNYILKHGLERLEIYDKEKHPYSLLNLDIPDTYVPVSASSTSALSTNSSLF